MSNTPSRSNLASPEVKLRMRVMAGDIIAIGPGKIELLETINETKSIAAAAKSLGMSYRRAWLLVDGVNHALNKPAVITSTGGSHGGGTELTETGHLVIALLLAWGGTFVILLQSSLFLRLLGEKGVNALERLMGLILVMMATQMFLDGIRMWMKG